MFISKIYVLKHLIVRQFFSLNFLVVLLVGFDTSMETKVNTDKLTGACRGIKVGRLWVWAWFVSGREEVE